MDGEKGIEAIYLIGVLALLVSASIVLALFYGSNMYGANEAPTASFDWSPHALSHGEKITFDASQSKDPDGSIVSYKWDFDDGTTSSGKIVTHVYQTAKPYTVTLTVVDDDGATDSENHRIGFAAPS